jgi:hypothetical protein
MSTFDHTEFLKLLGGRRRRTVAPQMQVAQLPLPISGVPPEIFTQILLSLDIACYPLHYNDLIQMQLVSKEWREIILYTPDLWKTIILTPWKPRSEAYLTFCLERSKSRPLTIRIWGQKMIELNIQQILLSNAHRIQTIICQGMQHIRFYQELVTSCPNLRNLVDGVSLCLQEMVVLRSLERLSINSEACAAHGPNVRVLALSRDKGFGRGTEILDNLPQRFPSITNLRISCFRHFPHSVPDYVSYRFPGLTKLSSISNCCTASILRGSASTIVELSMNLSPSNLTFPTLPLVSLLRMACGTEIWSKGGPVDYPGHQELVAKFPSLSKLLLVITKRFLSTTIPWHQDFLAAFVSNRGSRLLELNILTLARTSSRKWSRHNGKGQYRLIGSHEEQDKVFPIPAELVAQINQAMACV